MILWPRPYPARRAEDYDAAVAQVWVLYYAGLLMEAETTRRDDELRRMRESFANPREGRGRPE